METGFGAEQGCSLLLPVFFSSGLFHLLVYTVNQNQSKSVSPPLLPPHTCDWPVPAESVCKACSAAGSGAVHLITASLSCRQEFSGDWADQWAFAASGFLAVVFFFSWRANWFVTQSDPEVVASQVLSTENFIALKSQGFCFHHNGEPDSPHQSRGKCQQVRRAESRLPSSPRDGEHRSQGIIRNLSSLSMMLHASFYS